MIRKASIDDLEEIDAVEKNCFPAGTAATRQRLRERLTLWPDRFWLLFHNGKLVSYTGGMVTDAADLTDDMYADAGMHRENGAWQMIFSVCTLPGYRGRGFAGALIQKVSEDCQAEKRKGIVLTCREPMISFYESFGFREEGVSESVHGGVRWVQMRKLL